jgi:Asp-tRNA(Asn)/Glu-tRNA(Gln) amidotransferase A subunit family amidase
VRHQIEQVMEAAGIDLWICPAALGPAPAGIASTGSPYMNLVWTHAGLPALSVPAGRTPAGLPLGLQLVGRFHADEQLLACADGIASLVTGE